MSDLRTVAIYATVQRDGRAAYWIRITERRASVEGELFSFPGRLYLAYGTSRHAERKAERMVRRRQRRRDREAAYGTKTVTA